MDRRDFLRLTGALTAGLALPRTASRASAEEPAAPSGTPASGAEPGWRTYEITTRVEVMQPAGVTPATLDSLKQVIAKGDG